MEERILLTAPVANASADGVAAASKLWFTDSGTDDIQTAELNGSNVQQVLPVGEPVEMALDVDNGKVYWLDVDAPRGIKRANLDGTNVETVIGFNSVSLSGLAIDATNGKIYWSDSVFVGILRADLDGTNLQPIVTGLDTPQGIALDVAGGKVYWTDEGTDRIQRANLDGSIVETLVLGLAAPHDIVLDVDAGHMYWTDFSQDVIKRAELNGGNQQTIVSGLSLPLGLDIDPSGGHLYWVDNGTKLLQRSDLDGSNVTTLISGLSVPVDVVLEYGTAIQVAEGQTLELTGAGTDPDGDPITFEWDLDGDGVFGETGAAAANGDENSQNPTFETGTLDGPGSTTVTLRVTDDDSEFGLDTLLIEILNSAPDVDAGGPYNVAEGSTLTLSGSATDPAGLNESADVRVGLRRRRSV